ncbi:MAG: hypothetical protein P1U74_04550 [Legionellaceae bacterium]|nr:hypothetical protein [Legionellaceae bacterium]
MIYRSENFANVDPKLAGDNPISVALRKRYIDKQFESGPIKNLITCQPEPIYWKSFDDNARALVAEVRALKSTNNSKLLYQLEQILGQVGYLYENNDECLSLKVLDRSYNLMFLAKSLPGRGTLTLRYIGGLLIGLAVSLIVISSMLLFPISMIGAIGGILAGALLLLAAISTVANSYQHGLSLKTRDVAESMLEVSDTFVYYEENIATLLTDGDSQVVKTALKKQLEYGFPPEMLKNALIWARNRDLLMPELIREESYVCFFKRIAEICNLQASSPYYLCSEYNPNRQTNLQTESPQNSTSKSFACFFKSKPSASIALDYFNKEVDGLLYSDTETIRSGIKHLVEKGFSANDLKSALELAVTQQKLSPSSDFYERVVDICGVVLLGSEACLAGNIDNDAAVPGIKKSLAN